MSSLLTLILIHCNVLASSHSIRVFSINRLIAEFWLLVFVTSGLLSVVALYKAANGGGSGIWNRDVNVNVLCNSIDLE